VYPEDLHAAPVEGDRSAAGWCFRVAFDDLVAGGGAVAFDGQHGAVEVDVAPSQPVELGAGRGGRPARLAFG
jgi:hypothetical protein